jgi:hypothetical protein
MPSKFLAVLDREQPGANEKIVAVVYVDEGQTCWRDETGTYPYRLIPPNEEAFESLQSSVEQGDRRFVVVSGDHFDEVVHLFAQSAANNPLLMAAG